MIKNKKSNLKESIIMSGQNQLDTEALTMANNALTRIEMHEKHCLQNHEAVMSQLSSGAKKFDALGTKISSTLNTILGSIIVSLVAALVSLALYTK